MLFNRIMYFLLLFAAIIFLIFFDGYLAVFFLLLVLCMPIISFIIMFFLRKQIVLSILPIKEAYFKNEKAIIRLTSYTKHRFLSGKIAIRLKTTNTFTGEESKDYIYISPTYFPQSIDMFFSSKSCGSLLCKIDEVKIYDFLMLFSIKKKTDIKSMSCKVAIMPEFRKNAIEHKIKSGIEDESLEYSKRVSGDDPSEIFDIREYREGDRIRRIHRWLSEKHDSIIIKDFGEPIASKVLILVDFSDSIRLSEATLELLYEILQNFKDNEIKPAIKWFDANNKHINEYSENDFDIQSFFAVMLESSSCNFGLIYNYNISEDFGKYSSVIYIGSKLDKNSITALYELSNSVSTTVYEICDMRNQPLKELQNLPLQLYVLNA